MRTKKDFFAIKRIKHKQLLHFAIENLPLGNKNKYEIYKMKLFKFLVVMPRPNTLYQWSLIRKFQPFLDKFPLETGSNCKSKPLSESQKKFHTKDYRRSLRVHG